MVAGNHARIESTVTTLAAIPLFRGTSRKHLRHVADLGTVLSVGPGRVLCRENEIVREFVLILAGRCLRTQCGRHYDLEAGAWFGGVPSGVRDRVHHSTFVAATPMRVLVYDLREYRALIARLPEIAARIDDAHVRAASDSWSAVSIPTSAAMPAF